jgi:hypothetical protein
LGYVRIVPQHAFHSRLYIFKKLHMLYNDERVPQGRPDLVLRKTVIYPFQSKLPGRACGITPPAPTESGEIATVHGNEEMIENPWDGDEDDFFGDKEHGSDNEDSATMIISKAAIDSMATRGGHCFVAATSTTSTSLELGIIPEDVEDGSEPSTHPQLSLRRRSMPQAWRRHSTLVVIPQVDRAMINGSIV